MKEPKTADMAVLLSLLPNTIIAFLLSLVLLCFQKDSDLMYVKCLALARPHCDHVVLSVRRTLADLSIVNSNPECRMQNVSLRSSLETKITRVSDNESSVRT